MTTGPEHAVPAAQQEAARAPQVRTAGPAAPVPLPAVGTLVVGHAEDRAEAEADALADSALARLAGADAHVHGPGCDHLRRTFAPAPRLLRTVDAPPATAAPAPAPVEDPVIELLPGEVGPEDPDEVVALAPGEAGPEAPAAVPRTMMGLLRLTDPEVAELVKRTDPADGVVDVLRGAFECDWFKAKSCLVFDKWPAGRPTFSHASSLKLMTALTVLRGKVHARATERTKETIDAHIRARADQLGASSPLRAALNAEADLAPLPAPAPKPPAPGPADLPGAVNQPPAPAPAPAVTPNRHVDYKGSVGADTVTSDVDVSTGGLNSEIAVRAYNEAFREIMDTTFDPGTVFDLNVYAMDFIHGRTDSADLRSFTVKTENPEQVGAEAAASRDREQDIWALVHVARYLPLDADWDAFVADTVRGITDPTKVADQTDRLRVARRRAKAFEDRLLSMMEHLEAELELDEDQLEDSSWDDHANLHHLQGALRMRAANKIYEDKLLQVKELRASIAAVRTSHPVDVARLQGLIARLDGELSMAQLYANEVYGTGGGTVHAVMGMQVKKKLATERGHAVDAVIPKQQWYQTFTDNLGDVLKDYEHYGRAHRTIGESDEAEGEEGHDAHGPEHEPDYWYAAFKMGKYADRMVDAIPHLSDGGPDDLISVLDKIDLQTDANVVLLTELARQHVAEKNGPSKDDPMKLKDHPYFKAMDAAALAKLRRAALDLGALVRKMVATTQKPTDLPDAAPAPAAAAPGKLATSAEQRAPLELMLAGKKVRIALEALSATAAKAQQEVAVLAQAPEAAPPTAASPTPAPVS